MVAYWLQLPISEIGISVNITKDKFLGMENNTKVDFQYT